MTVSVMVIVGARCSQALAGMAPDGDERSASKNAAKTASAARRATVARRLGTWDADMARAGPFCVSSMCARAHIIGNPR